MKWNYIINGTPLGSGDAIAVLSGGYSPRKKEWVQLALAAASLASSIWGGVKSAEAEKEAERKLAAEKARNDAWYNRRYNEHTIDTAGGQNMIRMAKEYARENWKKAAGAAAVGGGTEAATAIAKDQGNKMVGDVIANIEAQDVARKDNIDAAYRARQSQITQQEMAIDQQRATNISQTASGLSNALASGASYFEGSPGGGGVNGATKTNQLKKEGIASNDKWQKKTETLLPKLYQANKDYSLAKKSYLYNPELFWSN